MKKFIVLITVIFVFLLAGCNSTVTSENGFDITDLDSCIDSMVADLSSTACTDRASLMEEYVHSFEGNFVIDGSNYTDSDFEFGTNRESDTAMLRYWFQYTLLDRTEEPNNYDTYKDIVQTIVVDLNTMNESPEYQIEGEFFHLDGYHFIFERLYDETLTGEIQIYDTQVTIDVAIANVQTFIDSYGIDQELSKQTFQLMTLDHDVITVVDVANNTYQYKIFHSDNEDTNTISQVETLVETIFNGESLTLSPWTID